MNETISQIQIDNIVYDIVATSVAAAEPTDPIKIGSGEATGKNAISMGGGSAEGTGSIVIGSGAAYGENSVAIGANTSAGCRGFYIHSITKDSSNNCFFNLSTSQAKQDWSPEATVMLREWHEGDKISYRNGTRYVLKSTVSYILIHNELINGVATDTGASVVVDAFPSDTFTKYIPAEGEELNKEEYSIVNPYRPEAGVIPFAAGSFAVGESNSTTGTNSVALGYNNMAAAEYSYAEGYNNIAKGTASHAEGWGTVAGNHSAHAEGCQTTVNGAYGHAEGRRTLADKTYSHAEGYGTVALGMGAHAEGGAVEEVKITGSNNQYTLNKKSASIKIGQVIYYNNIYATITSYNRTTQTIQVNPALSDTLIESADAIILRPVASGAYSHAEGYGTVASGMYSHAECMQTRAAGSYTHAEGTNTIASGNYSHAEGHDTTTEGVASHAQNKGTIAKGYATTAIGYYNNDKTGAVADEPTDTNYALIIGNGKGSATSQRANAFTVDFSGNVTYNNSAASTGADYAEYFEWADQNPGAEDRIGCFVTLANSNQIALANMGDEILGVISGHAAIIGDAYEDSWNGMYDRDIYGRLQYEEVEVEYEEEDEEGNITTRIAIETHIKRNPNYDPTQTYIPRSQRPEWAPVGLLGKLVVIDDGSSVPGKKCTCGINGAATASETGYHVLKRLDDTHIQILLK